MIELEIWKVYKISEPKDVMNQARWGKRVYEVSDQGNVKVNGELIDFTKYIELGKGYLGIGRFYIHRAVAELFVPNPENKPEVDHINRNRYDNRAENLRWVTRKENANNRADMHGENNPMYHYNYTDDQIKEMSERVKKRMQNETPGERKKYGRSGSAHHNYNKHPSKDQIDKQTKSINDFYKNPDNRKKQSNTMKEYYKTHSSAISRGSKMMTDGISRPIYVEPEYWGEFIDIGYHFGAK